MNVSKECFGARYLSVEELRCGEEREVLYFILFFCFGAMEEPGDQGVSGVHADRWRVYPSPLFALRRGTTKQANTKLLDKPP